jgi:hypothetical protein
MLWILELSPNLGDGLMDQAAALARGAANMTAALMPPVNVTPWIHN